MYSIFINFGGKMNYKFTSLSLSLLIVTGNSFAMEKGKLIHLPKNSINFSLLSAKVKDFITNHPFIIGGTALGITGIFTYKFFARPSLSAQYNALLAQYGSRGKAFHKAIENNDLKLVNYILSQEHPAIRQQLVNYSNSLTIEKHNSLVKAIIQQNKAMVEVLLANGANPQFAVAESVNALECTDFLRAGNSKMQEIYNTLKLSIQVPHIAQVAAQEPALNAQEQAQYEAVLAQADKERKERSERETINF